MTDAFSAVLARVQKAGLLPETAQRLLAPLSSAAVHDAERMALEFAGRSSDDSPADLLSWLESDSVNSFAARGMLEWLNNDPDARFGYGPSLTIATAVAAQVYVYGHHCSRIIVPDYRVADVRRIVADPQGVFSVDPYYFEELIAFIYELMGLTAVFTKRSGDEGADVLVWHPSGVSGPPLRAVQVKRYAPQRRVGIAEVQRMKGVVLDFKAQHGEIVTTSWFTEKARLSATREPLRIELTDFDKLQSRIEAVLNR